MTQAWEGAPAEGYHGLGGRSSRDARMRLRKKTSVENLRSSIVIVVVVIIAIIAIATTISGF
jgi:hypothetical protein